VSALPTWMKLHHLRADAPSYRAVLNNAKSVEIRFNDRNFEVGDLLNLCEQNVWLVFTGRSLRVQVTHIDRDCDCGLADGFVALSFRRLDPAREYDALLLHGEPARAEAVS